MRYVCDAPPNTWFCIETVAEAEQESQAMSHAVAKHYRQCREQAEQSYVPPATLRSFEQKIGLKDHIQRTMPMFVTLRDNSGKALVTGMLPPGGKADTAFRPIIVGPSNGDPFPTYSAAIAALGRHIGMPLEADRCFPYRRAGG